MTRLLLVVLLLASLAALSINAISKMVAAAPTSGHQSYWTPTNITGSYHILLEGVDSTFKIGNNGLKACIEDGKGHRVVCHPITNIPEGKNRTVDAGYFVLAPEINKTLSVDKTLSVEGCTIVKFGDIGVCIPFHGHEMHFDMQTKTYNEVEAGVYCAKDHRIGTKSFVDCVFQTD